MAFGSGRLMSCKVIEVDENNINKNVNVQFSLKKNTALTFKIDW